MLDVRVQVVIGTQLHGCWHCRESEVVEHLQHEELVLCEWEVQLGLIGSCAQLDHELNVA